jgi:hypothetical protein
MFILKKIGEFFFEKYLRDNALSIAYAMYPPTLLTLSKIISLLHL